jgi:glucuronosyltransferase
MDAAIRFARFGYLCNFLYERNCCLGHKNVKAFITHGGFNSVLEAVHTATPMVNIPLFADQFRNSRLAEKHGFGHYIAKSDVSKEALIEGLTRVLQDQRYVD